jgi:hypothetical protein
MNIVDFSAYRNAIIRKAISSHDIGLIKFYAARFEIKCNSDSDAEAWFTAFARFHLNDIIELESLHVFDYPKYGKTYMTYACQGGHFDTVKYLVKTKKIVPTLGCHIETCVCCSPFKKAVESGNVELVKYLYDNSWTELGYVEWDDAPLTIIDIYKLACFDTQIDVFKFLAEKYLIEEQYKPQVIKFCITHDAVKVLRYMKSMDIVTDMDITEVMKNHCDYVISKKKSFYSSYECQGYGEIINMFKETYNWDFTFDDLTKDEWLLISYKQS